MNRLLVNSWILVSLSTLLLPLDTAAQTQLQTTPFSILEERQRGGDHFTQGLFYDGQRWWESSGRYRRSWLAEYTDPSANPIRRKWLAKNRFAEGLTVLNDKLYLLTYKAGEVHIYQAHNLKPLKILRYAGEGWGLTSDGQHLIMSNGSNELVFRDPETFDVVRRLKVQGGGENWSDLNELEFAEGLIWANIWQNKRIIAIDPQTGGVRGAIDLSSLNPDEKDHPDTVANGIAWDKARNGLWVTGKYWRQLYLIRPQGLGFGRMPSSVTSADQ
ncbi:glutaminyl-peptide cyclotransferase [Microbulbifer sp. OS29]|uniref:Glutaminyl-peptide cyclotransferase n=1 Tax=Microbulbifer okhotskensis TaxID=2926617 RepID=A0A9X2EP42_9GAMM|nr:glutaminyl-peptide cyclotransferase [Microbulbifer okhotskensis]MCO1335246.1 glutaminyl-peptide cyclotransferase [Microbulbifer okhotskensis]